MGAAHKRGIEPPPGPDEERLMKSAQVRVAALLATVDFTVNSGTQTAKICDKAEALVAEMQTRGWFKRPPVKELKS